MIEQSNLSQPPVIQPTPEILSRKNRLMFYLISLVVVAILSGGGVYLWQKSTVKITEMPVNKTGNFQLVPSPVPQGFNSQLFVAVVGNSGNGSTIILNLFDSVTKEMTKQKTIDLSSFQYKLALMSSRFVEAYRSEPVKITKSGDVVFGVVDATIGGMGDEVRQNIPFQTAIYKTNFSNQDLPTIIYQTKNDIRNMEYVAENNTLVFTAINDKDETIYWQLDLSSNQSRQIFTLSKPVGEDQTLVDFRVKDGKILQLVRYGPTNLWINNRLELITIDIKSGSIETKDVFKGDGIEFDDTGLSLDNTKVAFQYIYDKKHSKGVVKDLVSNELKDVPDSNSSVFYWLTDNESYIYSQSRGNWQLYDLGLRSTEVYDSKINPIANTIMDNKIVGIMDKEIVVYDLSSKDIMDTGIKVSNLSDISGIMWN